MNSRPFLESLKERDISHGLSTLSMATFHRRQPLALNISFWKVIFFSGVIVMQALPSLHTTPTSHRSQSRSSPLTYTHTSHRQSSFSDSVFDLSLGIILSRVKLCLSLKTCMCTVYLMVGIPSPYCRDGRSDHSFREPFLSCPCASSGSQRARWQSSRDQKKLLPGYV